MSVPNTRSHSAVDDLLERFVFYLLGGLTYSFWILTDASRVARNRLRTEAYRRVNCGIFRVLPARSGDRTCTAKHTFHPHLDRLIYTHGFDAIVPIVEPNSI
jgi:hypothetical protein